MEDDMFLDDDLDDIPDNTLLELEQNAISSTQRQKASQAPPPAFQSIPLAKFYQEFGMAASKTPAAGHAYCIAGQIRRS
jgi:hypothetical protein